MQDSVLPERRTPILRIWALFMEMTALAFDTDEGDYHIFQRLGDRYLNPEA